ncbi:exodeoxyribonuclease I [Aquabacterium fontiphilum]|jgi:exodeoxyribonuclease-1|uniref:exodeoxyribonuclease I n=1 Tax=Aquabacterium fontiphilum TaxID=450365 RepID=UPI00137712A1|nr:exodeoxyribonuclease I [Aquabacterium fontiphilum]NBD21759.1 exodeoxyribonuclease I [Aquabacterium fontiphilum]
MAADFTFYWHDYETFGRVPRRDRPAQFAGIRTDADLNEVGAPLMVYCQPAPDYLPDPESCLLTGILPQHCLAQGLPEHAFAEAIERELAEPSTVGLGYNTIRFDDEVTRHLFWRNLIDPYGREWQNGCGRWDLLDVVRCTWALRPEGITWPLHEDGRPSFKLEHLTKANGLAHEAAHDALSDVRATIALARLIRQAQPRLWEHCLKLRKKDAVLAEAGLDKPRSEWKPFLHISGMFGHERGCMALVWPLAQHPSNKNELLVWDLTHDPSELFALSADDIRLRLFTKASELPEGMSRLPIKSVHINKSPVVVGNLKILTPALQQKWGLQLEQALAYANTAAAQGARMDGIWAEVFARPEGRAEVDVDEDLYGGFIGNDDRRLLTRLRGMSGEQLAQQYGDRAPAFADERLGELFFRYRARNFPDTLTDAEQARWHAWREARLHSGQGGGLSLQAFFERIDQLGEQLADDDERGQDILGALYEYAEQIAP